MSARMQFDDASIELMDRPAERLVVKGFRCWVAGYDLGDINCWEVAWQEYSNALGARTASGVITELQFWVRILRHHAMRELRYFPHCCRHVCRDECMALSMISAYQRQDLEAVGLAAHYLTGDGRPHVLNALSEAAGGFAGTLSEAGQILFPVSAEVIHSIAAMDEKMKTHPIILH